MKEAVSDNEGKGRDAAVAKAGQPFSIERLFRAVRAYGHVAHLGMEWIDGSDRHCTLGLPWRDELIGDPATGIIASGPIIALMDMAGGMAVWARAGAFLPTATLDLRFDYVRAARQGSMIHGYAECYRMTKSLAFVRGIAHDGNADDPVAHVAGIFMAMGDDGFPQRVGGARLTSGDCA